MIIGMNEMIRVEMEIVSSLKKKTVPLQMKKLRQSLKESDELITLSLIRLSREGYIDIDVENGVISKTLKSYQPEEAANSNLVLV